MPKSPDAFRTISEVADWLGVQAHVLRFWESKFAQVKPIKRAGGRRYYRPQDMLLLGGLKKLLHEDGLTIKGAQKLLREHGVPFVADQSQPLDDLTMAVIADTVQSGEADTAELAASGLPLPEGVEETEDLDAEDTVIAEVGPEDIPDLRPRADEPPIGENAASDSPQTAPEGRPLQEPELERKIDTPPEVPVSDIPEPTAPGNAPAAEAETPTLADGDTSSDADEIAEAEQDAPEPMAEPTETLSADPEKDAPDAVAEHQGEPVAVDESVAQEPEIAGEPEIPEAEDMGPMPSFRARSRSAPPAKTPPLDIDATPASPESTEPAPEQTGLDLSPEGFEDLPQSPDEKEPPKARQIDVAAVPDPDDITVDPSVLTALSQVRHLSREQARDIKPLLERLTRLHAGMANPAKEHHKD